MRKNKQRNNQVILRPLTATSARVAAPRLRPLISRRATSAPPGSTAPQGPGGGGLCRWHLPGLALAMINYVSLSN